MADPVEETASANAREAIEVKNAKSLAKDEAAGKSCSETNFPRKNLSTDLSFKMNKYYKILILYFNTYIYEMLKYH